MCRDINYILKNFSYFFIGVREVPANAGEKVAMVEETIKETLCVHQYSFMLVIYII
jgi:hypothetical protein